MKMNKKATAMCAFVLGTAIFTTAAFADVVIGSGYNSVKTAIKTTMGKLTNEVDNFTVSMSGEATIDGEVFVGVTQTSKFDVKNNFVEHTSKEFDKKSGEQKYYNFRANGKSIHKNNDDGTYYVNNYEDEKADFKIIEDPFQEEMVIDAEKVVDAVIGGLKDVVLSEEGDSNKVYYVNMQDSQIPAVINAGTTFIMKYTIFDEYQCKRMGVPVLKSDIYLKEVSGKLIEGDNGIIESMVAKGSLVGKDAQGIDHEITLEATFNISDINNTVVTEPNLENEKVTINERGNRFNAFDPKFVGTYKNNITAIENSEFVKKGERVVEITSVDADVVTGKVYETGTDNTFVIDFSANRDDKYDDRYVFNYTDKDGIETSGIISRSYSGSANSDIRVELGVTMRADGYSTDGNEEWNSEFIRQY